MNRYKAVLLFFCLALFVLAISPSVNADERNQKTKVTFNQPVEVPGVGAQVLPAGTYVFKVMDFLDDRHVVRIYNADETHIYTTILAIGNIRLRATDETVMTFRERAAGQPKAIRAWFYPGRETGFEFVYPKYRAIELAKVVNEPVLATPVELTSETPVETLKTAPVVAIKPTGEEVPLAEVVQTAPATAPAAEPVKELPHTASPLPLLALIGLLSLCTGFVFRSISKRTV